MSIAAVANVSGGPAAVRFTGDNPAFRRIVVRGALLELVTFGFYRFWVTTDIRRHLWSHTEVDGDAFEYTGRGSELLIGFLLAMAILGPLFIAYFLLGLQFEQVKAFASLPLYLLLIAFGQFAAYRARRYRLTRTVWRGVRFWMTGSGWSYAWRSMLWGLLLWPTIGFAYPWRWAALERFKLRHTLYGTLPGRFEGSGGQLFRRVWWIWLLGISPFVLVFGGIVMLVIALINAKTGGRPSVGTASSLLAIGALMFVALPFLHGIRRAREWNWWCGGIRFGDVSLTCTMTDGSLIGVYWKLIGMFVLVVLAFSLVAGGIAGALFGAAPATLIAQKQLPWWGFALFAALYLVLIVTMWVVIRIYTVQRVWRRVVDGCTVVNIAGAANVGTAGELVSAFGEGLADGLDFGL